MEQQFKKGTIIFGSDKSGKSQKAIELVKEKLLNEVVFLTDYNESDQFAFGQCNESTKAIVIDELNANQSIESFFIMIQEGLKVNKQGKKPFIIHPEIIIVLNSNVTNPAVLVSIISRRFNFINTNNNLEQ